ncbi:ACP S-malonyltransferase [Pseudovibrio ascidiaceicola]|uniref:ACP S-malonyltransferase n=1 Tax=Pseudovibrio ascidiaceicola TaxID=285279 RepID=UPI000D697EA1|nr:ACP S-malonyltransferase [Pseudovibrio ascidiaceicola]
MNTTCWLFPGQGSQSQAMGKAFLQIPAFSRVIEEIETACDLPVSRYISSLPDNDLKRTDRAQLGIFAMSMGVAACLQEKHFSSIAVAGHSLGHFSALTAAGVLDLKDAAMLVRERGRLMLSANTRQAGGMGVVQGLSEAVVNDCLEKADLDIWPANINLFDQVVVSGRADQLNQAKDVLVAAGGRWVPLNVSGAFHSPLLDVEAEAFADVIDEVPFHKPERVVLSNSTGRILHSPEEIRNDLKEHMTSRVSWFQIMAKLSCLGISEYCEVGPGKVLTGLLLRHSRETPVSSTGTPTLLNRYMQKQRDSIEADSLNEDAA